MNNLEQIEQELEVAKKEAAKFYEKGNQSAGTRLRKSMQNIKNLCQDIRKEVSDIKNS